MLHIMALEKKITIATLNKHKADGEKFAMLTCYDATMASIQQSAGVEVILVGDSLAGPVLGLSDTIGVSLDISVSLTAAVRRGAPLAYLVADMPFLTYTSPAAAVANGGRYVVEARADCVKVECDRRLLETIRAMATAGIPVMPHMGLTPQRAGQVGGYKVAGKTSDGAIEIIETAEMMVDAGASALLLEAVPPEPAEMVAKRVSVPVIGCGAGAGCDGFVVVTHDMIGLTEGRVPKFVKKYADLRSPMQQAFETYVAECRNGTYPAPEHGYAMSDEELTALKAWSEK
ncbi:MAG: 3-methyl-2-oxobutanoate hydroxymethyltransferase [Planctomycetota bacterium]|nr:3-methyl-2-oxobutanoate hydroxymethyltransferase [Planctomycetota bacterium]